MERGDRLLSFFTGGAGDLGIEDCLVLSILAPGVTSAVCMSTRTTIDFFVRVIQRANVPRLMRLFVCSACSYERKIWTRRIQNFDRRD